MNLSDVIEAAVYKELVRVDLPARGSNQHEVDGVKALRDFFGTDERSNGELGDYTFYDARENKPSRTEWRLYYRGQFLQVASERDVLVLIRIKHPEPSVHALIFQRGSSWLLSAERLFGVSSLNPSRFETFPKEALASKELGLVEGQILAELGIESFQIPSSEKDLSLVSEKFKGKFPTTKEMSLFARTQSREIDIRQSDGALESWLEREEQLFRALECSIVEDQVKRGFDDVDQFVSFSLSVQNRRKSRMGYSLQNQLAALFDLHKLKYEPQALTEGKNKPDFLFPSSQSYHDATFAPSLLAMLGAKSSLKERWRQVLTEAERIPNKHLCTLEPGISTPQTEDIKSNGIQLVIPHSFHVTYTDYQRQSLWTVSEFIEYIKKIQK